MQSKALFETGMISARVAVLLAVFDPKQRGIKAADVSRVSGVKKTMVSESFAALEHDGLLYRHTPERDKRSTVAYLTRAGAAAARRMLQAARLVSIR